MSRRPGVLKAKQQGHAGKQQDKYDKFLQNHAQTFQAFLKHSGLAYRCYVQQLADKALGTEVHVNRNTKIHASDAGKKDAKKMGVFVDMLRKEMP
ncbi:hypothetical protein WJX77_010186 [Trebouxia sp. C0004]